MGNYLPETIGVQEIVAAIIATGIFSLAFKMITGKSIIGGESKTFSNSQEESRRLNHEKKD